MAIEGRMRALWLLAAALNGFGAVVLGAAARHLWAGDPHSVGLVDIAVRYALPHAAALIGLAALPASAEPWARRLHAGAGNLLAVGTTLFSGGLLGLAAGMSVALGPIVPVGGTLMILGWMLLLAHAAARLRQS